MNFSFISVHLPDILTIYSDIQEYLIRLLNHFVLWKKKLATEERDERIN